MTAKYVKSEDYPTIGRWVYYEKLKFCGCGSPETVLLHLKSALRAMKDQSDAWRSKPSSVFGGWTPEDQTRSDGVRKSLGGGEGEETYGAFYYMTAYLLSAADLTEHGGSIPGWLTEDGEAFLKFLEETPQDEWLQDPWDIEP